MSDVPFTGERLHEGEGLFGVDIARHRAAYRFAIARAGRARRILDLGSGSGYGAVELGRALPFVVGLDRVPPDRKHRRGSACFVRGDLGALPMRSGLFDLVVSFQVIEHLEDPTGYLETIGRMLRPEGEALLTTPNALTSDGENPFHVREYRAEELAALLGAHFEEVELRSVAVGAAASAYFEERMQRIRRITRLDPLGLRHRLPRRLIEWIFGRLGVLVRRGIDRGTGLPDVSWRDFPIGPLDERGIDLLALCRKPLRTRLQASPLEAGENGA